MNFSTAALLSFAFVLTSCSAVQRIPKAEPSGFLRLEVTPPDALLVVDDRLIGQISGLPNARARIPVGVRRVLIQSRGYFPQRFDLTVEKNEEVTVATVLDRDWKVWLKDDPKPNRFTK